MTDLQTELRGYRKRVAESANETLRKGLLDFPQAVWAVKLLRGLTASEKFKLIQQWNPIQVEIGMGLNFKIDELTTMRLGAAMLDPDFDDAVMDAAIEEFPSIIEALLQDIIGGERPALDYTIEVDDA